MKGLFLSFQKIIKCLTLDQRDSSYGRSKMLYLTLLKVLTCTCGSRAGGVCIWWSSVLGGWGSQVAWGGLVVDHASPRNSGRGHDTRSLTRPCSDSRWRTYAAAAHMRQINLLIWGDWFHRLVAPGESGCVGVCVWGVWWVGGRPSIFW